MKGIDHILSFFTATIIELSENRPLSDSQLRVIFPYLKEGLKFDDYSNDVESYTNNPVNSQFRRSCCMIIVQICRKTKLAKALVMTLVGLMVSNFVHLSGISSGNSPEDFYIKKRVTDVEGAMEVLTVITLIGQHQKITLSAKVLNTVFADVSAAMTIENEGVNTPIHSSIFLQCINTLVKDKKYDIQSLLRAITSNLTASLLPKESASIQIANKTELDVVPPILSSRILNHLIVTGMLSDGLVASIVWKILQVHGKESFLNSTKLDSIANSSKQTTRDRSLSFSDETDVNRKEIMRLLRCVAQRYPIIFDTCVQTVYTTTTALPTDESSSSTEDNNEDTSNKSEDSEEIDPLQQLKATTSEIESRNKAKAQSIQTLLTNTFCDAPYHLPNGDGVSLLLSLSSAFPTTRIDALTIFAHTVPVTPLKPGEESSADILGLARAAGRCLTDENAQVASAAWNSAVFLRITHHLPPSEVAAYCRTAITYWTDSVGVGIGEGIHRGSSRTAKIKAGIFKTLADPQVSEILVGSEGTAFAEVEDANWLCTALIHGMLLVNDSLPPKDDVNLNDISTSKEKSSTSKSTSSRSIMTQVL